MNAPPDKFIAHAKVAPDGTLSIPRDVLERQGWTPGMELELDRLGPGLMLRLSTDHQQPKESISLEEFRRRMPKYDGPPASLEDMERAIEAARRERWLRKERNSQ